MSRSLTAIMDFRDMASVQYFLKKILPELLKDNADSAMRKPISNYYYPNLFNNNLYFRCLFIK